MSKGNVGAGKHAGVIAFGVTTSLGAGNASVPSKFRGNVLVPRVQKLQKIVVAVVFVGRVVSVVFLVLRSSHIQRSPMVFVDQACI